MLAKLATFSMHGIEAMPVEVEVDVSAGALPKTILVGLPEAAVRETTHRVERALANSGFQRPQARVVINLAPAELPKQAAAVDLPVALGLLAASGQIEPNRFGEYAAIGELSLDGATRPVRGALSMAMAAAKSGVRGLLVPRPNAAEAAVVEDIDVISVSSLAEAAGFLTGELDAAPEPPRVNELFATLSNYDVDFSDVRGQDAAKRAVVIAAAGGHNLLMLGPPGSGKTMLAKRIPTILPQLSPAESLAVTRIYSAVGLLDASQPLLATRPFRAPHHTISDAGLVGGGSPPTPGEISLSHDGVLFLDELPEFHRRTLEVLRQPLEDGSVAITRAIGATVFPARFMLVAALNPCPCGYRSDPRRECHCSVPQIERYMAKISGPLLDRIDLHIEVPAIDYRELRSNAPATGSQEMRTQVDSARAAQSARFGGGDLVNARMSSRQIRAHCPLGDDSASLLRAAMEELGLSARAHDKVLRVARTIADLDASPNIGPIHISEAISYRMLDRTLWT